MTLLGCFGWCAVKQWSSPPPPPLNLISYFTSCDLRDLLCFHGQLCLCCLYSAVISIFDADGKEKFVHIANCWPKFAMVKTLCDHIIIWNLLHFWLAPLCDHIIIWNLLHFWLAPWSKLILLWLVTRRSSCTLSNILLCLSHFWPCHAYNSLSCGINWSGRS